MSEKPSKEQLARLQQARLRQQQTQARIESSVTESLLGWITRFIRPIVGSNAIYMLTPRYVASYGEMMSSKTPAITAMRQADGRWELHFKVWRGDRKIVTGVVPFNADGPAVLTPDGRQILKWGVTQLGSTVWAIDPSTVQPGLLHAFIVMRDVPEPAPWQGGV